MGDGAVLIQAVLVALVVISVTQLASLRRARRRRRRTADRIAITMPRHAVVPAEWRRRIEDTDEVVILDDDFEWDGGESAGLAELFIRDARSN